MFAEFLITFREALEAALVVGIILAYLERTNNTKYNRHIYLGVAGGIVGSVLLAFLFQGVGPEKVGIKEEIFEGVLMLVASAMITWMILWMLKQKHVRTEIEKKIKLEIDNAHAKGLMIFTFIAVLREGFETVIFLAATTFANQSVSLAGALGGIIAAVALAFAVFETAIKINFKMFFSATSALLILLSAGLVAHAAHEFEEAGMLPEQPELWNTKWILNDKEPLGSIARVLVGYNDNPDAYEVSAYLAYLAIIGVLYLNIEKLHKTMI